MVNNLFKNGALFEVEKQPEALILKDRFVVPPFSILDTRQGYWQNRKRNWLQLTGNLSETRDGAFGKVGGAKAGRCFGDFGTYQSDSIFNNINDGTSNFDPVLAEIAYRWFCPPGGKILDPFGGEQTKGVVAGVLGFEYQAVEFRQEQVDLNNSKIQKWEDRIKYHCGDSNNISSIIIDRGFDMCFTSPPYYDLEVYSKEDMSALGTYEEFMAQYKNIFAQCCDMLADNRFLVVKVGEIRDRKTGEYRNFVGDTITIMKELGMQYYNDIVLVNAVGTAPIRANNSMKTRKVVKVHQNVLVFYKGNMEKIRDIFPEVANRED